MPDCVYLSSPGIVCPLGSDLETIAERLFAGDQSGFERRDSGLVDRRLYCGVVRDVLPAIPADLTNYACRNNQLLLAALQPLREQVERVIAHFGRDRIAVIIGSSTSGIAEGGAAIKHLTQYGAFPPTYHYQQQEIGTPAEFLGRYLHISGPVYTVSTACTSSTKAFVSARNLLRANVVDAVIVGGADSLCELTLAGFSALESTSNGICDPFSATRDGINIGEGAGLFILSREPTAVMLSGVGESSDAFHISSPEPNGAGAELAMRRALESARLHAAEIAYINLHGTATRKNDEMEARAVHRVFGDQTPCSSTKALTGHLLGAAGVTEVIYSYLTLLDHSQRLPPQVMRGDYDAELPPIALVKPGQTAAQAAQHVMSCNYAFGGSNAALILSRV